MPSDSPATVPIQQTQPGKHQSNNKSQNKALLAVEASAIDLQTVHHVASQSSDLASFADFFRPPDSAVDHVNSDNRSLAADFQGGLSGLYSRLKASVAGSKDVESITNTTPSVQFARTQDKSSSQPSSGRVSRVQSPRATVVDPVTTHDPAAGLIQKNTSSTRPPSSLALRSPQAGPLPAASLNPAVTEVNVHVTSKNNARGRPRMEHMQENDNDDDGTSPEEVTSRQPDRAEVTSASQVADQGLASPLDSPLQLPRSLALPKLDTGGLSGHVRALSEASNEKAVKPSTTVINSDISTTASTDASQPRRAQPKAANLLELPSPLSEQARDGRRAGSIAHVSSSRLPGFTVSRTSSSASSRTPASAAQASAEPLKSHDGHADPHYPAEHRDRKKRQNRLLDRDFWMKDENAKYCFRCGEPFTTFRRKHHCRACGQIFDNRCTTLISGTFFSTPGTVRVCRPCEVTITTQEDDSSDYSEDDKVTDLLIHSRTPGTSTLARYDDDNISIMEQNIEDVAKTPVMSYPLRKAMEHEGRTSAIFEFAAQSSTLHRPSSSRSLRTVHLAGHGHKRHSSRHHSRNPKIYHNARAPFQSRHSDDHRDRLTSAFHRDSVIDPELAQYLSDEATSDEELSLRPSESAERLSQSAQDHDRSTIGGLLAAMRKGRPRFADRSIAVLLNRGWEGDDTASTTGSRVVDGLRASRRRSLSVASSIHSRPTPRMRERLHIVLPDGHEDNSPPPARPPSRGRRLMRSASMHGLAAPSLELNRASLQHVHKMLAQQLKSAGITKVESWQNALVPVLLKATDEVNPNPGNGDAIDIRRYVKIKKIPGGRPGDTAYTSGVIFSKTVALKDMPRTIHNPRILIVTFPIEYARREQHFMSLDPVVRQETEYLENVVGRIAAQKPDVLLSQRNISGKAIDILHRHKIAVVYNVKSTVLDAVARCTQTPVIHSLDRLASRAGQLGICELFEIKTFVAGGQRKSYVFLTGSAPELGCTITLRGAGRDILHKIKKLTEFMVYVVYNLKLETCLMRDEWAMIPCNDLNVSMRPSSSSGSIASDMTEALLELKKPGEDNKSEAGLSIPDASRQLLFEKSSTPPEPVRLNTSGSGEIPAGVPVPTFYQDMADKHQTKILSASPFVQFAQPYLLQRARELERRVAYLKMLRDQDLTEPGVLDEKNKGTKFVLIQPDMVHNVLENASMKVREIVRAVHDAEYEKALYHYEVQKKQWEAHLSGNKNLFDPYAHQNIVVLFSMVSTDTSVPCEGPDTFAIQFYNEDEDVKRFAADCTLGQYVEDLVYRADAECDAESCGKKLYEHHRQYVHGDGQVTVFLLHHPPKMKGLQDVILMWSICKVCGMETTVTPMSTSTWKYSFGKYLELSFWSANLRARVGTCTHDLHRDHLRFFGFKGYALRIHYDKIDLLEVIVPRIRITWKVDNDLKFRNNVFTKLEQRITRFMFSVKLRLKSINVDAILPEKAEACRQEVENLTKQANDDHTTLIKQLQERYSNSRHWEIVPLNQALRSLTEKVADWDYIFTEFEKNFFPSEKDIRRLATLQLRKIFLDSDVSVTSLTTSDSDTAPLLDSTTLTEKSEQSQESTEKNDGATLTRKLSPEKTQDVLESVVEEDASSKTQRDNELEETTVTEAPLSHSALDVVGGQGRDLEHLDLAIANAVKEHRVESAKTELEKSADAGLTSTTHDSAVGQVAKLDGLQKKDEQLPSQDDIRQTLASASQTSLQPPPTSMSRRTTVSRPTSPVLSRTQSQPAGSLPVRKDFMQQTRPGTLSTIQALNGFGFNAEKRGPDVHHDSSREKVMTEQLSIPALKSNKFIRSQSMIPRAVNSRKESRVSNLAKHFEQLSREFERERIRERRLQATRNRYSRIHPVAAPKPIVEVFQNANEAVSELDETDESSIESRQPTTGDATTAESMLRTTADDAGFHSEQIPDAADITEEAPATQQSSIAPSENGEEQEDQGDSEGDIQLPDSPEDLLRLSQEDIAYKDLPKHERTSLMKMLTSFWAERSSSGWSMLDYPTAPSDHIFSDCDIVVREDELSSIIAFACDSEEYKNSLAALQNRPVLEESLKDFQEVSDVDDKVRLGSLLRTQHSHLKYQFQQGSAKMLCKVMFAEQFDSMRQICGVADRYIESMSRCMKFDSKGGKSKSIFLKTLDDRFVIKSLSQPETQSFLKFAPNYFQLMAQTFYHDMPSVIAKMLGFYQIILKNPATGVEHNWCLLVMENLFYDRTPARIFDLKGSMRNRKIAATGEQNEVLLDENMVEFIYESPLFAREHSKRLLRDSVFNDTLFLARQDVMDYSLMIAIDSNPTPSHTHTNYAQRKELVVGIIDCIRTYTWDKKLESWIKAGSLMNSLIIGGGATSGMKNRPTVTSPKEYKRRFREAMSRYVLEAPDCWHQFRPSRRVIREDEEKDERRETPT